MSEKLLVKELLRDSSYWTLNKTVVKMFGIETALLLAVFSDAENMMSDKNGWFYQTSETIEQITGLTRYKQDGCINLLEKEGILQKEVRGMPAKRFFKLDYKLLANKIVSNLQTSSKKTNKLDCKKLATNKESNYKESNYKELGQSFSDENNCLSGKPDTTADNCPHKKIISYLNDKANKKFSYKTEGHRKLMLARWNEGYTLEDFYQVIDNMTATWLGDSYWENYLTPQTLFRPSNFDKYLNMNNHHSAKDLYNRVKNQDEEEQRKAQQDIERGRNEFADLF